MKQIPNTVPPQYICIKCMEERKKVQDRKNREEARIRSLTRKSSKHKRHATPQIEPDADTDINAPDARQKIIKNGKVAYVKFEGTPKTKKETAMLDLNSINKDFDEMVNLSQQDNNLKTAYQELIQNPALTLNTVSLIYKLPMEDLIFYIWHTYGRQTYQEIASRLELDEIDFKASRTGGPAGHRGLELRNKLSIPTWNELDYRQGRMPFNFEPAGGGFRVNRKARKKIGTGKPKRRHKKEFRKRKSRRYLF